MPRRSGRTSLANSVHTSTPEVSAPLPQPTCLDSDDLRALRISWKWAAFSQFITTFSSLLNMTDVTVNDVETDLVSGSRRVIPRVMQKLLYTLTYDRKISIDNWQSALRRQYLKRDPLSNPLGPEPPKERKTESRESTPENTGTEDLQGRSEKESLEIPASKPSVEAQLLAEPSTTVSEASRAATQEFEDVEKSSGNPVSIDWFDLPVLAKLESMHLVTEWQFQNPTRLRTLMRSDDELATWRHEPIGYDSKRNAYWLIGDDRLWIQRVPPKPVKSLKRKRPAENQKTKPTESTKSKPSKRQRTIVSKSKDDTPKRTGRGRAAKLQAKIKLDAQAKELAALNQQARGTRQSTRTSKVPTQPLPSRALGTRISARIRGTQSNEWQDVPDGWLNESSDGHQSGTEDARPDSNNVERDDSISDLTELSDDSDDLEVKTEEHGATNEQAEDEKNYAKQEEVDTSHESFIEWETICVTLQEWEHIAERFEKATHYLEKALYKYLTNEIVPDITEALREVERKKRLEDALVHRKRSSRIAVRESEREEARLAKQREAEEAEKMGRARRAEARRQREEEERSRREQAREQRRKEREARELRRQADLEHEYESSEDEPEGAANPSTLPTDEPSSHPPKGNKQQVSKQRSKPSVNGVAHKAMARKNDWELDCEICRQRGVNLDDRTPMMSCGKCFKWQHIACHDQADARAGRSKRNWDSVEFVCQRCRSRMFSSPEGANSTLRDPHYSQYLPQGVNLTAPYQGHAPYQSYAGQGYGPSQIPQSSSISSLYHDANGSYSHYTQPYGDIRAPHIPTHYPTTSQAYIPTHHYTQPSSAISFSHYQPREGGFSKSQSSYQGHRLEAYDQQSRDQQQVPYSELRSSANPRSAAPPPPTQSVWSLGPPNPAGSYTSPYHSTMHSNGSTKRDPQLQPNTKPGPSSSNDFSQQPYPSSQFRYHSTT